MLIKRISVMCVYDFTLLQIVVILMMRHRVNIFNLNNCKCGITYLDHNDNVLMVKFTICIACKR